MNTIVVTGGAGFVGRHFIHELVQSGTASRIVVWDVASDNVHPSVHVEDVDITDPSTYEDRLRALEPDWIVHLAAVSSVPYAIQHPEGAHDVNVRATHDLLDAIVRMSPRTNMLVASSADIYGPVSSDPLAELDLDDARPQNPYAQSKLDMERLIEESYNERCIRVRPFPHIGPGQKTGFVTADFASQIAGIEAGAREPVITVGNLESARDFTDVRDVVRAYRLIMEGGSLGEVYHIASGKAVRIQYILDTLLRLSETDIAVRQDPQKMRPSDSPVILGDASKLKSETGWKPTISLERSLEDILTHWRRVL